MTKKQNERLNALLQDDMLGEDYKVVIREVLGIEPEYYDLVWEWETWAVNSWSADGASGTVYSVELDPYSRKFNAWGEKGDDFPTRTFDTFKAAAEYCDGVERERCATKAPRTGASADGSAPKRRGRAKGR
jgi:hypothetical protein